MSGICAIVNFDGAPVDPEVLRSMAEQCAYRGPDGIRYWIQGNVGLAHLALHATPESLREIQPQLSEDGMLCLTADARVDNRPELINLLTAKGQPVRPDSTDADLILAAYCEWGEACPTQIIGDYAFAIWDAREQRLFCARDAFGIKSLNYARVSSTLCVASEAQQIIQHPVVPRILDEVTVADYLVDNLNDETRTMFMDVHKVPPAHILTADQSGLQTRRYWDIDPHFQTIHQNDDEYAAHFLEIFQRAVADRLRTPNGTSIGITMSGGMDSTSVAAVAQQIINSYSGQPHLLACSYAFEYLKECDETKYSQAVADECGVELIYVPAENFWFLDNDETYTPSLETPFMPTEESVIQHILSIFAERNARVWFTGHGGDSLVGGSPLIYADRFQRGDLTVFGEIAHFFHKYDHPFSSVMKAYRDWILKPLLPKPALQFYRGLKRAPLPEWLDANLVHRTKLDERIMASPIPRRFPDHAQQDNYKRIIAQGSVGRAASWIERAAALFHLEARHPFLDRRLAEYLLSIPPDQTFRAGVWKYILREAMRGILAQVVLTRPDKTRFSRYFDMGFKYKETGKIREIFGSSLLNTLNLVYSKKLLDVYERSISEKQDWDGIKGWSAITLELWLRKHYQLLHQE